MSKAGLTKELAGSCVVVSVTEFRTVYETNNGAAQVRVVYSRGRWAGQWLVGLYLKQRDGAWKRQRKPWEWLGPFPKRAAAERFARILAGSPWHTHVEWWALQAVRE